MPQTSLYSSAWADSVRPQLEKDLATVLPARPKRVDFIERTLQEIDAHRQLVLPAINGTDRTDLLERLARTGGEFARAFSALDEGARDMFAVEIGKLLMPGEAWPSSREVADACALVGVMALAAAKLRRKHQPRNGRPLGRSVALVEPLAEIYRACFDRRPGAAREGTFARALGLLLEAASLPNVSEGQLRRALSRMPENPTKPPSDF